MSKQLVEGSRLGGGGGGGVLAPSVDLSDRRLCQRRNRSRAG